MNREKSKVAVAAPTQREVLCAVMLSAGDCNTWLTLHELSRLTGYGETSISAQLRHLRKPQFGSFEVGKRRREAAEVLRHDTGPVWEYRLERAARRILPNRQAARTRTLLASSTAL